MRSRTAFLPTDRPTGVARDAIMESIYADETRRLDETAVSTPWQPTGNRSVDWTDWSFHMIDGGEINAAKPDRAGLD